MSTTTLPGRLPWTDRWTKPCLEDLLAPLKAHHRRQFNHLIQPLEAYPLTQQEIIWYGPSWKWTIAFSITPPAHAATAARPGRSARAAGPADPVPFCYLVPNVEAPLVCIPLDDQQVRHICRGQLPRYIREAVINAKCPVTTRWATWTPTTENETSHILNLVKKKYELTTAAPPARPQDN